MSLQPGTHLGPYEMLAPLGAGGMGEVWKAKDTRLGRFVAVKVLPEHLAKNAEALARFEREAKAVAALNHPNITGIFDIGRVEDTVYAVMELLEGEPLRMRLEQGPILPRKAIELAIQLAQGLAAAHEKGVVHRDLKPDNLWITKEGRLKILDFGLAKHLPGVGVGSDSIGPTAAISPGHNTEKGMILGTLGYMSPEQVRGEAVDGRSDLFSFGAVLFEMLTGKRAFARDTAADTQAAILKEDPLEIPESSRPIPPGLLRVLHHCLEKASEERFQSARDLAFDLQSVSGSGIIGVPTPTADLLGHRKWLAAGAVVVLLAGAVVGSFGLGRRMGQRSAPAVTYHQRSFRSQAIFQAAFAPDGATIVYSAALQGHQPELFVIRPENPEPQSLGLPDTHLLSVSSRGELAVLTKATFLYHRLFQGTLARAPIGGAAPREILEGVTQADWSPDGSELAIIHAVDGKQRLEYPIGNVLLETAGYLSDLRVSPRGDRIAFIEHPVQSDDGGSAVIVDRVGRRTWKSGAYPMMAGQAWSPLGDELFFSATTIGIQESIFAVDLKGQLRIALSSAGGLTMHDVSQSGRWLVTHDGIRYQISGLPPGAREEQDLSFLDACSQPHLSRDGHQMEFADESAAGGPTYSVCLRDTNGGPVLRLGPGQGFGLSPDGKRALAVVYAESQVVLYPTGPGEPLRLPRGPLQAYHGAAWFPDGKRVLLVGNEPGRASRCYEQDLVGGLPHPLTPEGTNNGRVSPDGRQILYLDSAGVWFLQPTEGGMARVVSGMRPEDRVQQWSLGDGGLYVFGSNDFPRRLERLDLATGRRTTVRLIAPTDRTGALWIIRLSLSDDAKAYAYSYNRMISQLFVVEGAR